MKSHVKLDTNYVYLHGFNSGIKGFSDKVEKLNRIGTCHLLGYDSFDAQERIVEHLMKQVVDINWPVFVGTSLGAYYASVLGEALFAPSVLINPLLDPEQFFIKELVGRYGKLYENYATGEGRMLTHFTAHSYQGKKILQKPPNGFKPIIFVDEGDDVLDSSVLPRSTDIITQLHTFPGGGHRFNHMEEALPFIQSYACACEIGNDINT
jgi:predicted esterase YcpF (UPF0227 family)